MRYYLEKLFNAAAGFRYDSYEKEKSSMPLVIRHTADELLAGLSPALLSLLQTTAQLGAVHRWRVALVGGSVRDLGLGVPLDRDLDVLVEGDAPALATALASACGGSVTASHDAFGTATVLVPGDSVLMLDLAGARSETYSHPAALPVVAPATLEADLKRRDFSLNALAIELSSTAPPVFHDPFNGIADLEAGVLRVLHANSFIDDPTRILRGLRLAARLGLHFEQNTRALLAAALDSNLIEQTSPDRIRNELCLVLNEPRPEQVLECGDAWGITPHVFPALHATPALRNRMERAHAAQYPLRLPHADLALGILTYDLSLAERDALIARYRLPGDAARLLREVAAIQQLRPSLADAALADSQLDRLLQPFGSTALLVAHLAESPPVVIAIDHYLADLRPVQPLLKGRDLLALGVLPGPHVGQLLIELRAAVLDGVVKTREEGMEFIQKAKR